jgi:predicted deacylase
MLGLDELDLEAAARGTTTRQAVRFATLPDGQAATFPLILVKGRRPGPTAALVGGIHGDEFEGPSALWRLADALDPAELAGRLLIVPLANLPAFAAGTRTSPVDGQNLARIFPGDPDGTLSFRLAHALFEKVVRKADFLVDCHSGGVRLAFLDVAGFYAAEAPIEPRMADASLALARDMGLSHLWRLPPRAGVLSYEAMRQGIPATGGEIGGRGGLLKSEADGYFHGIRRILARRGMIAGADVTDSPSPTVALQGDWELAPVGGFIDNHVSVGDRVSAGTPLATIRSPLGEVLAVMEAKVDGLVMGVRHLRSISPGEWATCAVREVPL